jgi:hypothetical protein
MTNASTERPSETQDRLQYAVRRLSMRKKLSATRLTIITSAIIHAARRKYNRFNSQCEKMPDTHNSPEKAERLQSDLKIVTMLTYDTESAISTYGQLPLSPTHRYISTKLGRSTKGRPKYQRAKHNQGLLNPRKSRGCLQVPNAYLHPYR